MFKYTPLQEQLIEERKKNAALKAQTEKNTSDIDYVAMMTDIDLDNEVPNETEADENEQ